MNIDKDAFNESFTLSDFPTWKCSTCNKGNLDYGNETVFETVESMKEREDYVDDWDETWIRKHFIGTLKCNNQKCREIYSFAGEIDHDVDHEEENGNEIITVRYYPKYIFPILYLFSIPEEAPSEVIVSIERAFKLYWVDNSACGNAIRTVVEVIMNDKNIRRTTTISGKRKKLSLHTRIENFQNKYNEIGNILMAIKWIGNVASHDDELYKEELLDGFDFLKVAIDKLYATHEKDLEKRVSEINKRKKP